MMKHYYLLIGWIVLLAGRPDSLIAQDSTRAQGGHSELEAALNYQNDNVYLGRKDSLRMPYIIPMLTYNHRSGIYFSASAAWLNNSIDNRIDLVTLEGGYSFKAGHYSGDLTASKYFYNKESESITSGISASLAYQNGYDLGFIKPVMTATLDFGAHTDLLGTVGLEHRFYLLDDDLEITPSMVANASTLNFYNNYYKEGKFKKVNKKTTITGTKRVTGTVLNASAFRIMDYETSVPISYEKGRFTFSFTPTYAIPVHAAEVQVVTVLSTGTSTTKMKEEKLENSFFFTAGITYRIH
jgi:hypothetical protein